MDLNANEMYLMAVIETLKKENDDLKEEKMLALEQLEASQNAVEFLKSEMEVMKDVHRNEMDKVTNTNRLKIEKLEREKIEDARKSERKVAKIKKHVCFESDCMAKKRNEEIKSLKSKASFEMDVSAQIFERILFEFDWRENKKINFVNGIDAFDPTPTQVENDDLDTFVAKYINWLKHIYETDMKLLNAPHILSKRNTLVHAMFSRLRGEKKNHLSISMYILDVGLIMQDQSRYIRQLGELTLKNPLDFTVTFIEWHDLMMSFQ